MWGTHKVGESEKTELHKAIYKHARMQVAGVTIERDSISRIERGTRIVTDYELKIFSKALGVKHGMADRPKRGHW